MAKPLYTWTGTDWEMVGSYGVDGTPGAVGGVGPMGPMGPQGLQGIPGNPAPGYTAPFAMAGTLVVVGGNTRFYLPFACTIQSVWMGVGTAPTGAAIIADVNKNGTTIFTTQANRPTIPISGFYSGLVTNMNVTSLLAGDYLSVDVDQIGSSVSGANLSVNVLYLPV